MKDQYKFLLAGLALLFLVELGAYLNGVNAGNVFELVLVVIIGYCAIIWSALIGTRAYAFLLGAALLVLALVSVLGHAFSAVVVRTIAGVLCLAISALKESKLEIKIVSTKTKSNAKKIKKIRSKRKK